MGEKAGAIFQSLKDRRTHPGVVCELSNWGNSNTAPLVIELLRARARLHVSGLKQVRVGGRAGERLRQRRGFLTLLNEHLEQVWLKVEKFFRNPLNLDRVVFVIQYGLRDAADSERSERV